MKKKSTAVRFNGLFLFSYAAGAIGTTQTIPYLVSMGFEGTPVSYTHLPAWIGKR